MNLLKYLKSLLSNNGSNIETRVKIESKIYHIRNGKIIATRKGTTFVNSGKSAVAGLINGVVTNYFEYIAIGTSSTAESASQTALGSETHRASATTSRITTNVSDDTAQWVHTFSFTSSYAICESGIFDSSSGGTMLARAVFSTLNVESGDKLQVTWKAVVS